MAVPVLRVAAVHDLWRDEVADRPGTAGWPYRLAGVAVPFSPPHNRWLTDDGIDGASVRVPVRPAHLAAPQPGLRTESWADRRALAGTALLVNTTGLGMMLHQAVAGFAAWFDTVPDMDAALHDLIAAGP